MKITDIIKGKVFAPNESFITNDDSSFFLKYDDGNESEAHTEVTSWIAEAINEKIERDSIKIYKDEQDIKNEWMESTGLPIVSDDEKYAYVQWLEANILALKMCNPPNQ